MKENLSLFYPINYKKLFFILAAFIGILMPILSFDYGVIEDGVLHKEHGELLLNYFSGKDTLAATNPILKPGDIQNLKIFPGTSIDRNINVFGGFFDLFTAFTHRFFSFIGIFEYRNLINSLLGFLLFLFAGLLAKELAGWKSAVMTLIFIVLTPLIFGHSMNNPKDIPFAAFYMFSLFHIIKLFKELPVIKFKRALSLIINLSLLCNVRFIGLCMFGFLFLAAFLWWIYENSKDNFNNVNIKKTSLLISKIIIIGALSYLAISIFWPYVQTDPILGPIRLFRNISIMKFIQLFEGKWISNYDQPWYFIPKWLAITIPLHVFIGIFLIVFLFIKRFSTSFSSLQKILFAFVLFSSFFPIIFAIISNARSYDNARHYIFTLPPLIVLTAISWENISGLIKNIYFKISIYFILFLLLLQSFTWMIKNHPLESIYFSPIVGGVNGAFRNYELDYWGFAVRPAVEWLSKNAENATPENPARVRLYYGSSIKATYYIDKHPNLKFVAAYFNSSDWDYSIFMTAEAKHYPNYNLLESANWPPKNTVYEVKVEDVVVCAVVKNTLKSPYDIIKELENEVSRNPTSQGYINLSLNYYNIKDYSMSIKASLKSIEIDPKSSIAYNNLGAAYNALGNYEEAKKACNKALELTPNMELAKNNLKYAETELKKKKTK